MPDSESSHFQNDRHIFVSKDTMSGRRTPPCNSFFPIKPFSLMAGGGQSNPCRMPHAARRRRQLQRLELVSGYQLPAGAPKRCSAPCCGTLEVGALEVGALEVGQRSAPSRSDRGRRPRGRTEVGARGRDPNTILIRYLSVTCTSIN